MKTLFKSTALLLFIQFIISTGFAQVQYQQKRDFNLSISGTSTMHDWEMKTSKIACNATFTFYEDGELGGLSLLDFTMPTESLKSERTGLDAVAYNALKTKQNPTITFNLIKASVSRQGTLINCSGKLTVAGETREVELVAAAKMNADHSINIRGSKQIDMRDFDIEPPTFLFGKFKTGEVVTINFDLTFRQ
ncbi:YceI-like domain-containing protein [Chitinophaga sp. YR627]|uniref:YceI family protein n=1 Tax=Chitinophaga sp. YR627 TaxID=1881041 RepID=UPI0008E1B204|nr:YceI family protein [Chitinophaga sp. YR627]SFO70274.1 YceI-like domain-containing protein [Chitinophaga sp. YR627]